jgi:hypothetical protein
MWPAGVRQSVHWFRWEPGRLYFRSVRGHRPQPSSASAIVAEWTYTGGFVPPPGDENPRMNLWLLNGEPPINGREVEVIVSRFEFQPL